jgi:hypothetical protein
MLVRVKNLLIELEKKFLYINWIEQNSAKGFRNQFKERISMFLSGTKHFMQALKDIRKKEKACK